MTVLKWTGAISWGENGTNFVSFISFLRILASYCCDGSLVMENSSLCGCWAEVL